MAHHMNRSRAAVHHRGIPADHDTYAHAAIYPDAVTLAAAILNPSRSRTIKQDPLAKLPGPPGQQRP